MLVFASLLARPEATDDLSSRADADLNVIQLAKSGPLIQFPPLHEKPANGVKRRLALFLTKLMQRLHNRAVQISRPKSHSAILRDWVAIFGADPYINFVRRPNLFERLRVGKIKTVA